SGKKTLEQANENYKVILIQEDEKRFAEIFTKATSFELLSTGVQKEGEGAPELTPAQQEQEKYREKLVKMFEKKGGCFSASATISKDAQQMYETYKGELENVNIYEALVAYMLTIETRQIEQEPIKFQLRFNQGAGVFFSDFFGNFFDNFLVYPVGLFLWFTSSIFGGWYIIGLFITTILIRTAGWPIYAKTNDMSLKMQVIQPEMQKLEEKYRNRQDPDSQRMKQAELAQIYKKNKIGLGGCFLPFLQFPIFMAVYGAVRRFPYTVATGSVFSADWANTSLFGGEIKSTLFGLPFDLFQDYASGETIQLIGIIVLVVLVCGTQFLSQVLSEKRQKSNHERSQEDIPAYRRQAYKQNNNQSANTMKYVMYMMIFMMGTFVFTSKAGLGVYWLIGNLYSMLQMFINNELGQKKLKKMKEKAQANQYR
ncbi:YidC/Oxa1 family membrane protein insertase, partial [bacterium]|nr:YidC/Oxa1 family membrane protein insertase [bacterium]